MSFALQVAVLVVTLLSLVFHHLHNKRLNEVGDILDEVKPLLPSSAPNVKPSQSGRVSLTLMAALALVAVVLVGSLTSCTWAKHEETVVKTAAVDCTKGEFPAVIAVAAPLVEKVIQLVTGDDGKTDWTQVDDSMKGLAFDDGGCVGAKVAADLIRQAAPEPGAPKSSPLAINANEVALHFKAKYAGKTFHTASGDL